MFQFTPLLGAQSTSDASQSILELDGGVKILIDVGWDEGFDVRKLKELERQVPTLSVILLTHATTAHLGAFAHCCKHFPLFTRIPVYATAPVISLGRTLLQDLYRSTPLASTIIPKSALSESAYTFSALRNEDNPNILLQSPSNDEIASYFSLINPLKYSQPYQPTSSAFSSPLNGLTVTAYSAGHTLGGTIWHIQHGLESIVYAVDWNQARERVIPGAAWLGGAGAAGAEVIEQLKRPTAMICSSKNGDRVGETGGRRRRDEMLLNSIRETVGRGGTVLIPSDSSARVLELAYLLEDAWRADHMNPEGRLRGARLYLASKSCRATIRYARSMVEWMDEGIVQRLETAAQNESRGHARSTSQNNATLDGAKGEAPQAPFEFSHIKLLDKRSQLNRLLSDTSPRVIIASDTSMEWGFSRDALRAIASDERNLVILTERVKPPQESPRALARALWELWESRREGQMETDSDSAALRVVDSMGQKTVMNVARTVPLGGGELNLYQQFLARQRQLQTTLQPDTTAALDTAADAGDDRSSTSSESSEDSDVEHQGKAMNAYTGMSRSQHKLGMSDAELGVAALLRLDGVHDFDVRGKRGREKMFPFMSKRKRGDEFGDFIRPEAYLRAEEREDLDADVTKDSGAKNENTLGQKRKWDEVGPRGAVGARQNAGKRRKSNDLNTSPEDGNGRAGDVDESESEDESSTTIGPSRVIFETEEVQLNMRISFIDFAGVHDKQSLQMLIPLIKPRKLVLVAGEKDETLALAQDCRKMLGSNTTQSEHGFDVFTPTAGRSVDVSVDTNAWAVKLSQSLVRRLHWQNVKGLGVVAITGRLESTSLEAAETDEQESVKKKVKLVDSESGDGGNVQDGGTKSTAEQSESLPVLDVVPVSMASATRSVAQPLHVGDLRLQDLRKIMLASGFTAEFRGEGTLLVNSLVAVRKSGDGRIEVEGSGLSLPDSRSTNGTFNAVRRKIYDGLAVVAGG